MQAIIKLSSTAPLQDEDLKTSMHKTYTDCYFAEGFSGGNWAYSMTTNNVIELLDDVVEEKVIPEEQRRLAVYPLGWESKEVGRLFDCSEKVLTVASITLLILVRLYSTKRLTSCHRGSDQGQVRGGQPWRSIEGLRVCLDS